MSQLEHSEVNGAQIFHAQKAFFTSGATHSYSFRQEMLTRLERMVIDNQDAICASLHSDLRKPRQEAVMGEIAVLVEEVRFAKKNLRRWMRPERVGSPLALFPAKSEILHQPLGVVLIMGPWNYPFQLLLAPLIGAMAAGNCAILKPSELVGATSRLTAELVGRYFPPEYITVLEGGVSRTTDLLKEKFDHIFFTGSSHVGRIVVQAAAANCVPTTLELGGKSPVIVCEDADLDLAARRIIWGKLFNAGQTCVAPDYLYVHEAVHDSLLSRLRICIVEQFGEDAQKGGSLARILNPANHRRITRLIDPSKVAFGGRCDESDLYVEPTLMTPVTWDDAVMQQEIFGPILPILTYRDLDEVIRVINAGAAPLAAYIFSGAKEKIAQFLGRVRAGGCTVNDVMVHSSSSYLPFGGVGESGSGSYHGKTGFLRFSHAKSVMHRYPYLDLATRYAPYDRKKLKMIRWLFRL